MKRLIYFLIGLALAGAVVTSAADTITWQPPTEREDSTPLAPTEISGYNVYDLTGGQLNDIGLVTGTSFTIDRTATQQTIYITTVDTDGRESVYSQAAIIPKLVAKPKPPTIISVTP